MKNVLKTVGEWLVRTLIIVAGTVFVGLALYGLFYVIEMASQQTIQFLLKAWQLVCANLVISIGIAMLIALVWCIADYLMRKVSPWWDSVKAKREAKREERKKKKA